MTILFRIGGHRCLKGHVLLMQYSHNYSSKGFPVCCQGYVWDKIDNRCIPTRKIIPNFLKVNLKNNRENMPILQYFSNLCLNSKKKPPKLQCSTINDIQFRLIQLLPKNIPIFPQNISSLLIYQSKCTDTKCDAGTFGPKCEHICPYPHYGKLCLSECYCSKDHCNPINGCHGTIFSLRKYFFCNSN